MAKPGASAHADAMPFEVREVKAVPTVKGAEVSPIERLLKSALTSSTGIVAARCGTDAQAKSVAAQAQQCARRHEVADMFKVQKRGPAVYVTDLSRKKADG